MTEEATRYLDVVYGKDMLPKVYDNRIALLKEIGKLKGWKHLHNIKVSTIDQQNVHEKHGKRINYIDIDKVEFSEFYT
jgi:hypothetical protein|tara:strand:- start:299 stop:532 length:234 start_codon:yes stop_codon:yes gene_type:complete